MLNPGLRSAKMFLKVFKHYGMDRVGKKLELCTINKKAKFLYRSVREYQLLQVLQFKVETDNFSIFHPSRKPGLRMQKPPGSKSWSLPPALEMPVAYTGFSLTGYSV